MEQNNKIENVNKDEGISFGMLASIIRSHFLYFKSKWVIILAFFIAGALIGLLYSLYKKPKYVAQTTFTIDESSSLSAGALSGLASQLGISVGGGKQGVFDENNIVLLFKSRLMVQNTLLTPAPFENGNELLVNRYIEFNHYRDAWKKNPELANISFEPNKPHTRVKDSILNCFYNDIVKSQLDVDKLDRKLNILALTYVCGDELFSKQFSAALAKNVTEYYIKSRTEKAVRSVNNLQHQVDSVKQRLGKSLINVASSTDATPNANPLQSVLGVSVQNRGVEAEIDRATLIQLSTNLEASKIQLNQQTPLIDFIDVPILPLDVIKLSKLKGIAVGGVFGVFLCLIILTFRRKTY